MTTALAATTRPTRPDPSRRLWQVPTFIVGLAAFLSAWQGWLPLGPRDPAANFLRDLTALKSAGEKLPAEPHELQKLLTAVARTAEAFPEHGPAAQYALGSGYIRLAEAAANLEESATWWEMARQHFANVKPEQLTDPSDPPRFAYRSAKVKAAFLPATTPPAEIDLIRNVLAYTPVGEEGGEGQRLAAELSLRLTPPDLIRAKMALGSYVAEAGLATPSVSIARARLRLSEVQLSLGELDAARKWLEAIGPDAPPDVLAPAKAQLGKILMAERNWEGAVREWETVYRASGAPAGLKPVAAYFLGVCKLNAKPQDRAAALRYFEEAEKADGPQAGAAAIRLAELDLQDAVAAKHREAVPLLTRAVKGMGSAAEFATVNPLVPINEVQAAFELAVQVLIADGSFDAAVKAAEAYAPVAVAGRDREKRAEALAAWAGSLPAGGADAKQKLAAAADEYAALVPIRPAETDKADLLRRAANLYRAAGQPEAALGAVEKILALKTLNDEATGPVWVEYADMLLAANQYDAALRAFRKAMAMSGPASTAARYRLARLLIDTRDPKKMPLGLDLLQQIAAAERVGPAEQEVHELALVGLAHEAIRAGNFADAEIRLRTQLNRYPTGSEAGLGRLLLGIALVQQATPKPNAPESPKANAPESPKATAWRTEALALFKQIVKDADARKAATGKMTERDEWLRLQANLRVLQTYQQMARPYDVLTEAAPLLNECKGTVEELIIRSLMYYTYNKQLNQPENALRTRDEMRAAFVKLKDQPGAFKAASGEYSRDYWEKVWFAQ